MNKLRKLVGILLTMALILGMSTTAFADTTGYTITAPDNGHTYGVYQIFTGDLHDGKLSNVKWGQNGTGTVGAKVQGSVLTDLENVEKTATDTAKLATIGKYANLTGAAYKTLNKSALTATVPAGYYLIKDNAKVSGNDAATKYIVAVVGNMTITPKADVPTVEKKVKDTNDTTGTTSDWQDSADYDIGDHVPFQLTATMGQKIADYDTYKIVFNDTLSSGLTYDGNVKVTAGGKDITGSFTVNHNAGALTIACADVKAITNANIGAGSEIVVEYTATLNDKATIGTAGNKNTVTLSFSNDPNFKADGTNEPPTGETPEDTAIVFTYKVVANKVTEDKAPLTGAGFTLYKKVGNDYQVIGTEVKGEALTTFEWKGLDDGDYKLVETTTPKGYNTIEDIQFTITATHDITGIKTLTGGDGFTANISAGSLTTDVVNTEGTILPTTGGMGTTLLYVIGGLLVVAAGAVLIFRRRENSN